MYWGAQKNAKQSLYIELGGAGLLASINYEYKLLNTNNVSAYARGGLGYFPAIINGSMSFGSINPVIGFTGLYSFHNHHVELGISNTFALTIDNLTENSRYNDFSYLFFHLLDIDFKSQRKRNYSTESDILQQFISKGYLPTINPYFINIFYTLV